MDELHDENQYQNAYKQTKPKKKKNQHVPGHFDTKEKTILNDLGFNLQHKNIVNED